MNQTKLPFFKLTLFLLVALGWSYIFLVIRPIQLPEHLDGKVIELLQSWLPPIGLVIISALLRLKIPKERRVKLLGSSTKWSFFIFILPIVCLASFGVPNNYNLSPHYFGFIVGFFMMVYTFLEEYGWRGYLNEVVVVSNEWLKYAIIGVIWYAWHWSFVGGNSSFQSNFIFCVALIFASAGIGKIAEKTNSIVICAAFHSLGNMAFAFSLIANQLSIVNKVLILSICFIGWWLIIEHMGKTTARSSE